jgi:predicted transcriptional regulator of viral defense system
MTDVHLIELASRQHRCATCRQLRALGYGDRAIAHRVATGRLVRLYDGVYAVAPVLDDAWTRWMAATLTAPGSVVSHVSAGSAWGFWTRGVDFEVITRPGDGGPVRLEGLLLCRSGTLAGNTTTLRGVPITTPERTLIDLAANVGRRVLERAFREACRLGCTSPSEVLVALAAHRGRRGTAQLRRVVGRYTGLPLHRARSDAEALALVLLDEAGRPVPRLNVRVAGEEADLVWPDRRLIVELDGPQFHVDAAEDARKQRAWETAGWTVLRLPTDDVYLHPARLLALAANVSESAP